MCPRHTQHTVCTNACKLGVPAKQRRQGRQGRRAKMARTRAGRWNDIDRDLAERELAAVVVERQKVRLRLPRTEFKPPHRILHACCSVNSHQTM